MTLNYVYFDNSNRTENELPSKLSVKKDSLWLMPFSPAWNLFSCLYTFINYTRRMFCINIYG